MIDVSIVIVNWHSKLYVKSCLDSLKANLSALTYEIIVVDSASFDGCGELLARFHPHARFIQREENGGFAAANNTGAAFACGRALLFLNPDTEIRSCAVDRLFSALCELSRPGILGCLLLNSDGSVQTSCVQRLPTILNQLLDLELLQRHFPRASLWASPARVQGSRDPEPVEAVSGACMMMWREAYDRLGGFSTDYFMYAEDLDLCWKAAAAGFINYYVPDSVVVHHGGGSVRGRNRFSDVMIPESVSRLLRKMRGNLYCAIYRFALTASALLRITLLAFWLPVALVQHETRAWNRIFAKWSAVLSWGLGMEKWVRQYRKST